MRAAHVHGEETDSHQERSYAHHQVLAVNLYHCCVTAVSEPRVDSLFTSARPVCKRTSAISNTSSVKTTDHEMRKICILRIMTDCRRRYTSSSPGLPSWCSTSTSDHVQHAGTRLYCNPASRWHINLWLICERRLHHLKVAVRGPMFNYVICPFSLTLEVACISRSIAASRVRVAPLVVATVGVRHTE